jgi:uncharacterized membrane protein
MDLIGSIIAIVIGVLLLVWTVHIVLTILGWVLIVVGGVWLVRNLLGRRSRSDL